MSKKDKLTLKELKLINKNFSKLYNIYFDLMRLNNRKDYRLRSYLFNFDESLIKIWNYTGKLEEKEKGDK